MSINIEITGRDFDLQVIKNFMLVVTIVYLDNFTTVSNTDINRQEIKWHILFLAPSTSAFCYAYSFNHILKESIVFVWCISHLHTLYRSSSLERLNLFLSYAALVTQTTRAILPHMKYMQIYIHKGDGWYVDQWFHMRS